MNKIRAAAGTGVILLLAACARATSGVPFTIPPESATPAEVEGNPTPTSADAADQAPLASQAADKPVPGESCLLVGGEVTEFQIPGDKELTGRIYIPPCYHSAQDQRYPVLYMLHGDTETDQQWDDLGLDEWADTLIVEGEIPPLIIVMPLEITWINPSENPFGDQLVKTIVPWIDSNYRTIPDREHRALGGLSRGGNWAVRLGLLHWGLFGSIGAHSTPLFFGDLSRVAGWVEIIPDPMLPRILIDIGEGDNNLAESDQLHQILLDLDVPHERQLNPGLHNEDYWRSQIENYLRWYSRGWIKGQS